MIESIYWRCYWFQDYQRGFQWCWYIEGEIYCWIDCWFDSGFYVLGIYSYNYFSSKRCCMLWINIKEWFSCSELFVGLSSQLNYLSSSNLYHFGLISCHISLSADPWISCCRWECGHIVDTGICSCNRLMVFESMTFFPLTLFCNGNRQYKTVQFSSCILFWILALTYAKISLYFEIGFYSWMFSLMKISLIQIIMQTKATDFVFCISHSISEFLIH